MINGKEECMNDMEIIVIVILGYLCCLVMYVINMHYFIILKMVYLEKNYEYIKKKIKQECVNSEINLKFISYQNSEFNYLLLIYYVFSNSSNL